MLLESRIKLQNALNTVNQFPQYDCFDKLIKNLSNEFKKNNLRTKEESKIYFYIKAIFIFKI